MRLLGLLFILSIMTTASFGQNNIFFGNFPNLLIPESHLKTEDLLKHLSWEKILENDTTMEFNKLDNFQDSLLVVYHNWNIHISSFESKVISFNFQTHYPFSKRFNFQYFDRKLWIEYCHKYLLNLPDSFKLSNNEEIDDEALQSYYKLLGVGISENVYGWRCESGTVGFISARRAAVKELIFYKEYLNKLFDYPNIYTQLYSLEGIIYKEYLDNKSVIDKEGLDLIYFLKVRSHNNTIWDKVIKLRNSKISIDVCNNGDGGYIYPVKIEEILSDESIRDIPNQFKMLKLNHID